MYADEIKIITVFDTAAEQFVKFKMLRNGKVFTLCRDGFIKRFGIDVLQYFYNRKNMGEVIC